MTSSDPRQQHDADAGHGRERQEVRADDERRGREQAGTSRGRERAPRAGEDGSGERRRP